MRKNNFLVNPYPPFPPPCTLAATTSVVQMQAHKFELSGADDYTLNYMESRSHEGKWPYTTS